MAQRPTTIVNIDYYEKKVSGSQKPKAFTMEEFFDVSEIVENEHIQKFIQTDLEREINRRVEQKIGLEIKRLERQAVLDRAQHRLDLNIQYTKKISQLVSNMKKLLMSEFAITDVFTLQSFAERALQNLDSDQVQKVFVSQENYDTLMSTLGDAGVSVLGKRVPLGVGYGLGKSQLMLEGDATVAVVDLAALVDRYLDAVSTSVSSSVD